MTTKPTAPKNPGARRFQWTRQEQIAAAIAIAVAAPLVFFFGTAISDGMQRHRENAVRAMLGEERYEQLAEFDQCVRQGGSVSDASCDGPDGLVTAGFPHYTGDAFLAPDFVATDRQGRPWKLSDQRGKIVVMNFWSITCPPCIEEMPTLDTLAEIAEQWDDVEVVAVSTDAGWDAVSSVLPARPQLKHLFDSDKSAVEGKYGTKLYPETWIVDASGVIRMRFDGQRDWSEPLLLDVLDAIR